jgi:uncharacterized protein (TIGR02266 family)
MTELSSDDRRVEPRVTIDLWVEERSGDALYFQRATNLSTRGLFLERTLPHAPGTLVEINLRLPGAPSDVRLTAEVVPASAERTLGMGLRFVDLDEASRARITEYLRVAPHRVRASA